MNSAPRPPSLFSDLNQWMLKILLSEFSERRRSVEVRGPRLQDLSSGWRERAKPALHPRHRVAFERGIGEVLSGLTDDIRRAALISPERALTPSRSLEACRYGLDKSSTSLDPRPGLI